SLDDDLSVEVDLVFEKGDGRHHFRDAGNGPLRLGVALVEHFVRRRVVDDGSPGTNVRNQLAVGARLVLRRLEFLELTLVGGPLGARQGESTLAGLGCRIARGTALLRGRLPGRLRRRHLLAGRPRGLTSFCRYG